MSKTIVVPIDGSAHSLKALQYALTIAEGVNAEIELLNVQPSLNTLNVRRFISEETVKQYQQELADEALKAAVDLMKDSKVKYSVKVRIGVPGVEVVNEAKEREAMTIVMGSRGLGAISGSILGSVSYAVLHHAPCPVTVV